MPNTEEFNKQIRKIQKSNNRAIVFAVICIALFVLAHVI